MRGGALLLALVLGSVLPQNSLAYKGLAHGDVGLVDTESRGYGFSAASGLWTSVQLDSPAEARLAGDFFGYLRTARRIYAFNSVNDHWFQVPFEGVPMGESAEGATVVFWSDAGAYGIASIWTIWRCQPITFPDSPSGGGSAGNFALVWTKENAFAFHSASGQWMRQALDRSPDGGITFQGLGLVWTSTSVYSFDPTPGTWIPLSVSNPVGVSGGGGVAVVWGDRTAQGYSGALDAWFPLQTASTIQDGQANGQTGIVMENARAYTFNSRTGTWSMLALSDAASRSRRPTVGRRIRFGSARIPVTRSRWCCPPPRNGRSRSSTRPARVFAARP